MSLSARPILLLGGCGYIGSSVSRELRTRGLRVDSVDLEWFGTPWRGTPSTNQRRDFAELSPKEIRRYGTVILLAGHASVPSCARDPAGSFKNNVLNFVELLEKLGKEQRLVYASSARVYADTQGKDADESWDRLRTQTHYDLSKIEIDEYARLSGLDAYGLRFGTVSGLSPHVRTDVILNRMLVTHRKRGELEVTNPDAHRPILGMRDLVRAVHAVVTAEAPAPGIYNVASFNATLLEIGERAAKRLGSELTLKPPTTTYDMRMSTSKFKETFRFEFEETVESILDSLVTGIDSAMLSDRDLPLSQVPARR